MLLTMLAPIYGRGSFFSNLPLRLLPVLNCSTVLAAPLIIQFIRTLDDLRDYIDRFLSHGVGNEPFEHYDLHSVVDARHDTFAQTNIASVCAQRQGYGSRNTQAVRIVPVCASATKLTGRSC